MKNVTSHHDEEANGGACDWEVTGETNT